jgi:hypothetical protein
MPAIDVEREKQDEQRARADRDGRAMADEEGRLR